MLESLKLFGVAPSVETNTPQTVYLDDYHTVLVNGSAHWLKEIELFLSTDLTNQQLNETLFESWGKIKESSDLQLLVTTVMHYFSTYGLRELGIGEDDPFYNFKPEKNLNFPDYEYTVRVINTKPKEELITRCLDLLSKDLPLTQETIELVLTLLDRLNYQFTGVEVVKNKEAAVLLADQGKIYPKTEDGLFRYFFYKATGNTLVINNKKTVSAITDSKYKLPVLKENELRVLASGFNRRKRLWLAIKQANPENRSVVNRISKLSKKHHVPKKKHILESITSDEQTPIYMINEALQEASSRQLIKIANVCGTYINTDSRCYAIRNGKVWATTKAHSEVERLKLIRILAILHLQHKLGGVKIYQPDNVDYVLPTSENQMSGMVPRGTVFTVPKEESNVALFGVHWFNNVTTKDNEIHDVTYVDLDLSVSKLGETYSWYTSYRNDSNTIVYSGDVTDAPLPLGAAEWFYTSDLDKETYLLSVSEYAGQGNSKFKLLAAKSNAKTIEINHMVQDGDIYFQVDSECIQSNMSLGLISDNDTHFKFMLINQGSGEMPILRHRGQAEIIRSYYITQMDQQLRISDVATLVPKEECDIDLSLENLGKDTFFSLFDD